MSNVNDGGPAYPHTASGTGTMLVNGVPLRAYFAGQAMAGLLANPSVQSWDEKAETPHELAAVCALQSVLMADALIEELNR
jgi:CHASE2 domain-containing sensor protein